MALNYERIGWENAPSTNTPIDAGSLNHMDNGILAVSNQYDVDVPYLQQQVAGIPAMLDSYLAEEIGTDVTAWLNAHVTPGGSTIVVDDTLSISGAAADAAKCGELKNALNYMLDEVQSFANSGNQRLKGLWEYGDLNGATERSMNYRIRMAEMQNYPYDITIYIANGYAGWYCTYDSSGVYQEMIYFNATGRKIPANTNFRAVIQKSPEDTSIKADIATFASQITIKTPIQNDIDSIKQTVDLVDYTLSEVQQFSNIGVQRLLGRWEYGDLNNGIERNLDYRARMAEVASYSYDVVLKTASGYSAWIDTYDSQGVFQTQIDIPLNGINVAAGTRFRAAVKKIVEDTTIRADVYLFASQITTSTFVKERIDGLYENGYQREAEKRLERIQYKHLSLNSDFIIGLVLNNGVLNTDGKYRVSSKNIVHNTNRIYLNCFDDLNNIEFGVYYYNADGTLKEVASFTKTRLTIPADSYFRLSVRYSPEDTTRLITDDEASEIWNKIGYYTYQNGIVEKNIAQEQLVYNLSRGRGEHFGDEFEPLEFIHCSDIHREKNAWENLCDYMDKYHEFIPFALHTGDYVGAIQSQYTDLYEYQSPQNGGYILNCVGNHDTYTSVSPLETGTAKDTHDLLFNHISNWGVTFGSAENAMYYYKDFEDNGIRLIVLDQFYWNATQKAWFENLLADAITNNLAIVTAAHCITSGIVMERRVNCTFTAKDLWDGGDATLSVVPAIETAIADFIESGGEHIIHLCGHFHHDVMGYSANGILNYAIESATPNPAEWCDSERVYGTKGYDCFNVIAIDRSNKIIRFVRIGNNVDYYGRVKNILCYNYDTKTVIANS